MTGTIAWTYTLGDFENGTGTFTSLDVPWTSGVDQVEITMPGNWHNFGADVSRKLEPVLAEGQTATVELVFSTFDIEQSGIVRKGHMLSGALAPESSVAYCTAGSSASGCQATLSSIGAPGASAASGFVVTASTVEGNKDGLFFVGTSGRQANAWGNGTSFQCVTPR